ncbi:hypothetical protein ACN469_34965 [Corallococcus terminator]
MANAPVPDEAEGSGSVAPAPPLQDKTIPKAIQPTHRDIMSAPREAHPAPRSPHLGRGGSPEPRSLSGMDRLQGKLG